MKVGMGSPAVLVPQPRDIANNPIDSEGLTVKLILSGPLLVYYRLDTYIITYTQQ
jgi:hypothetical protein